MLERAAGSGTNPRDLAQVRHYFLKEWPGLDERPRSTVQADLTGLLDPLTRGKLAEFFGTTTNLSPDDLEDGRVIVIDVPMRHRQIAQYAALLWLHSVYRSASRRAWDPPRTRPLFVFIDETQYYLTPADAWFQSTSRHHGFSVVRLTQSLPGLRAAYGSHDETDALLSHCCTRIFHLNTCPATNEWASKSIGQTVRVRHSVNHSGKDNGNGPRASYAEATDADCPSEVFLDLRSGGTRHKGIVEAVVAQAGRTFLNKKRWIISAYRQSK
jgi:type IV secretory pathway TraG/TraD family ATPase VirD4